MTAFLLFFNYKIAETIRSDTAYLVPFSTFIFLIEMKCGFFVYLFPVHNFINEILWIKHMEALLPRPPVGSRLCIVRKILNICLYALVSLSAL